MTNAVQEKYGEIARRVAAGESGAACCGAGGADPITSGLYDAGQAGEAPERAVAASLGCGNPTALAQLLPGQRVLDLGSGGGLDVLLSARRVGPTGFAYGLDLTEEMLALAEENKRQSGLANVEFRRGTIEAMPFAAGSMDVVISNCVINLAGNKARVLREAFRVLAPGGLFAISDVVALGSVEPDLRARMEAWIGCIAGALDKDDYRVLLEAAGFEQIEIEVTRTYPGLEPAADGKFGAAFVRARKPAN